MNFQFIFEYCLAYFHLITLFWLDSLLITEKVNRKLTFLYVMRTNLTINVLSVCLSVRLDNSVNIVRSELEVLRKRSTFKGRVCSPNILGTVSNATWNLWMSGRQRRTWSDAASALHCLFRPIFTVKTVLYVSSHLICYNALCGVMHEKPSKT